MSELSNAFYVITLSNIMRTLSNVIGFQALLQVYTLLASDLTTYRTINFLGLLICHYLSFSNAKDDREVNSKITVQWPVSTTLQEIGYKYIYYVLTISYPNILDVIFSFTLDKFYGKNMFLHISLATSLICDIQSIEKWNLTSEIS